MKVEVVELFINHFRPFSSLRELVGGKFFFSFLISS